MTACQPVGSDEHQVTSSCIFWLVGETGHRYVVLVSLQFAWKMPTCLHTPVDHAPCRTDNVKSATGNTTFTFRATAAPQMCWGAAPTLKEKILQFQMGHTSHSSEVKLLSRHIPRKLRATLAITSHVATWQLPGSTHRPIREHAAL